MCWVFAVSSGESSVVVFVVSSGESSLMMVSCGVASVGLKKLRMSFFFFDMVIGSEKLKQMNY